MKRKIPKSKETINPISQNSIKCPKTLHNSSCFFLHFKNKKAFKLSDEKKNRFIWKRQC